MFYNACSKLWTSITLMLMSQKCWISGKQYRPWSDAASGLVYSACSGIPIQIRRIKTVAFLTLSVPNFRRHLPSAFFIITNCRLERRLYVKLKDWMSNSVDPDEPSHLDLGCLQKPYTLRKNANIFWPP